jgi:beta-glucanase (GH16 family)
MNIISKNHQKKYYFLALFLFVNLFSAFSQSEGPKRKLIWFDEFNYTGLPNSKKWDYEEGFVRNKEPQYYTRARLENASVANGLLTITARKEEYKDAHFTSASLKTLGKKHFRYGRMEMRAKVYKGVGGWPAFWMLGVNRTEVKWPNCGEIDILEYVGKDSTQVYGTVHYSDSTNTYQYSGKKPVVGQPYDGFHIYAVDWTENRMEFYYDNLKFFEFDLKNADHLKDNPFRKDFYLLLNLALGRVGTLGGPLNEKILPLKYEVDYVRVYK